MQLIPNFAMSVKEFAVGLLSKSNYISLGIIVQNGITNYFYPIWAKKTPTPTCA